MTTNSLFFLKNRNSFSGSSTSDRGRYEQQRRQESWQGIVCQFNKTKKKKKQIIQILLGKERETSKGWQERQRRQRRRLCDSIKKKKKTRTYRITNHNKNKTIQRIFCSIIAKFFLFLFLFICLLWFLVFLQYLKFSE